jgi:hypothetical protein
MDYYNFAPELYKLKFSSRGDAQLSQRVVELFNQVTYLPPSLLFFFPFGPSFFSDLSVASTTGRYPRSPFAKR